MSLKATVKIVAAIAIMAVIVLIVASIFLSGGDGEKRSAPTSEKKAEDIVLEGSGTVLESVSGREAQKKRKLKGVMTTREHREKMKRGDRGIISRKHVRREEINYIVTIHSDDEKKAIEETNSLIENLDVALMDGALSGGKENRIRVPRKSYLSFIKGLQNIGKLTLKKDVFKTETPSDSPVPFVLRFKEGDPPLPEKDGRIKTRKPNELELK